MSANRDVWVHVTGPRGELFERILGTSRVAVRSPATGFTRLPGFTEPQEVYLLDLDRVTEQGRRQALVEHIAGRFKIPPRSAPTAGTYQTPRR